MATARQTMQTGADEANVKTSVFEKISYGMGDVACNVVFALTSGLITYFYTNVMSVSAGMVGMIMLISRIFDGLSDVAIGLIMDKVHSKHGRGRALGALDGTALRHYGGGTVLPAGKCNNSSAGDLHFYHL